MAWKLKSKDFSFFRRRGEVCEPEYQEVCCEMVSLGNTHRQDRTTMVAMDIVMWGEGHL